MMSDDMPGLAEASEAAWLKWEDAFTEFWASRPDFQEDKPAFAEAVRAAYPIIAAAVREQVAKDVEGLAEVMETMSYQTAPENAKSQGITTSEWVLSC